MNQLLSKDKVEAEQGGAQTSQEVEGNREPGQIQLNIRVQYEKGAQQTVQLNVDQSAPFSILVQVIKQKILAQNMSNLFEESIRYSFNGMGFAESDNRSLQQIGLKNGSTLDVQLKYKTKMQQQKVQRCMRLQFKFDDKPSILKLSFKLQQQEQPFEIAIEDTKTAEDLFQRIKSIISPMNQPIIQTYKINDLRDEHIYNKSLRDLGYKDGMLINLNMEDI